MKTAYTLALAAATLLLGACAEKVQTAATLKSDDKPWATKSAPTAQEWTCKN